MASARWIIERGIGETRAALVGDGAIVEAAIELPDALRAGTVAGGRLAAIVVPGRVGLVALDTGDEALLQPLPHALTEGAALRIQVTREAIGHKRALCRIAADATALHPGPDLTKRLAATGSFVELLPHETDALEAAGWSEVLETATSGVVAFAGGSLLISLTQAMTLIDVDGTLEAEALCLTGAAAAARAIRQLGVAGSIGIDLPTVGDRKVRLAAAAALDTALPPPFERTAVNGFGFLQVVRPQRRASLPQLITADPIGAAARALLRRAERTRGHGPRTLAAHPRVIGSMQAQTAWLPELERRIGAPIVLQANEALAISAGHASAEHP